MKKLSLLLFAWLLVIFFWSSVSHAQSNWINNMTAKFCSWDNGLFNLKSWQEKDLCFEFTNSSDKELEVTVSFVDWVLTADALKNKTCDIWWKFGSYITNPINTFSIPAKSSVQQNTTVKFPATAKWINHWCLAYNVAEKQDWGGMFNVVIRKVLFLDINVDAYYNSNIKIDTPTQIWNISKNPEIVISKDKNNLVKAYISFRNEWSIDEKIYYTGSLSSMFWFSKLVTWWPVLSYVSETNKIDTDFGQVPAYWWLYKVSFEIKAQPEVDQNDSTVPENIKKWSTKTIETSVFISPSNQVLTLTWIAVIVLILIVFAAKNLKIQVKTKDTI